MFGLASRLTCPGLPGDCKSALGNRFTWENLKEKLLYMIVGHTINFYLLLPGEIIQNKCIEEQITLNKLISGSSLPINH